MPRLSRKQALTALPLPKALCFGRHVQRHKHLKKKISSERRLIMMKRFFLAWCISLAATVMPLFALTEAVADSNPGAVLGVDQLVKEVDRYKGPIRVEGIVTAVAPDRHMVALVDAEQFKKCGLLQCPSYLVLPVMWSGVMPSLKDAVIIEGQIKESAGKLFFEAKTLDKSTSQPGGPK
jgi:hypothetical protein